MTEQHPITPSPELIRQLLDDDDFPFRTGTHGLLSITKDRLNHVITQAARWGADQELKACCEWLRWQNARHSDLIPSLRFARRPKLPSDGEVAKLVASLREWQTVPLLEERRRAAELLEQLAGRWSDD